MFEVFKKIIKLQKYCFLMSKKYKIFWKYDIRSSYYSWMMWVLNTYIQHINILFFWPILMKEKVVNEIIEELSSDNKEQFELHLSLLRAPFEYSNTTNTFISWWIYNLYIGMRAIFERTINFLFEKCFPNKINQKNDDSMKNICKLLKIDFKVLLESEKLKILKELKDYPFQNKLWSLIGITNSDYKQKYNNYYKNIIDNIYNIRNSQHNWWINKNWIINIIEITNEIDKLKEFICIFENLLNNINSSKLDITKVIIDKFAKILD